MLGGIDRFIPCDIGANYCRLRHIGWEKCGHGLTSSPTKSASEGFLNGLLLLFRYPPRSAAALLEGTLPLRYCAGRLASEIPTFVAGLVTEGVDIVRVEHCSHAVLPGFDGGGRVDWVVGPGGGVERVRLNRKNSSTPCWAWFLGEFTVGYVLGSSCLFIGALMRSLCLLPGGLGRFVTCSIGANHCRLRNIGWETCGHGLASRPRESASEPLLNQLLGLFQYPPGSGVLCLLVLFLFGIVLLALLAQVPLGGYLLLVILLVWLLLLLVLGESLLIVLLMRFLGLVVLVQVGRELDQTEKLQHTLRGICLIPVQEFGRG